MWRMLAVLNQNLQNIRKSPRVADESVLAAVNGAEVGIFGRDNMHQMRRRSTRWTAFSVICSVVRAPFSIISCFSQPHVNGADRVWVSGEFAQISEMNHLMVSDSMRYAILM
ncbi:uncharacterized protein LOC110808729 [Carica papaya]|uniref:uncharacterized protein LOC110808729 n=1 Tax=Carica papaya TaxID=3649 RepID=UPI000B8D1216|nr:uncharacterized protein LOC110808729 [Carica papaya]